MIDQIDKLFFKELFYRVLAEYVCYPVTEDQLDCLCHCLMEGCDNRLWFLRRDVHVCEDCPFELLQSPAQRLIRYLLTHGDSKDYVCTICIQTTQYDQVQILLISISRIVPRHKNKVIGQVVRICLLCSLVLLPNATIDEE